MEENEPEIIGLINPDNKKDLYPFVITRTQEVLLCRIIDSKEIKELKNEYKRKFNITFEVKEDYTSTNIPNIQFNKMILSLINNLNKSIILLQKLLIEIL